MRRILVSTTLAVTAIFALGAVAPAALLYNPVVTRIGDGAGAAPSSVGTSTAIAVYQQGVAAQAAPLSSTTYGPGGAAPGLVNSGSATSEGLLSNNPGVANAAATGALYVGANLVYTAGYSTALGTVGVATAAGVDRSFGQATVTLSVAALPTVTQTQPQTVAYNTNNIRSATGDDLGIAKYTGGTATTAALGGWRNFVTGAQLSAGQTNVRAVELLGSRLFGSTGSGTRGIYDIDATGTNPATLYIDTGTTSSPYEFALFDDPTNSAALNLGYDTAYIADDTSGGGIQKWVWNDATWSLAYTLKDTGTTTGYRGLAGQKDTATGAVTLYASVETSTTSLLQQVTDTGAGSAFTTLASLTKADGFVFRGVALATQVIPEPATGSLALVLMGAVAMASRRRRG